MENSHNEPKYIEVRGACVHNLKNVNVNVPLHQIVGIAGVSGSGKSSLALGVLYAEGSRRYLESLSTYTRRRMTRAAKAQKTAPAKAESVTRVILILASLGWDIFQVMLLLKVINQVEKSSAFFLILSIIFFLKL